MNDNYKDIMKLKEAKRIERVLVLQRWLYLPAGLLTALLFHCLYNIEVLIIAVILVLANIIALYCNSHIKNYSKQRLLSFLILGLDTIVITIGVCFLTSLNNNIVVIAFILVVVEAAVRFELRGSLVMDIVCSIIILAINIYSSYHNGKLFTIAEYFLIIGIMSFISLMVGMSARSSRKHREMASSLVHEKALVDERHRMSNELHDSILKSLQGLSMEAYSMGVNTEPEIKQKANYIYEICQKMSNDIRNTVLQLRNDIPQNGFFVQLRNLVSDFKRRYKMEIDIVSNVEDIVLPLKISHDLFEIAEEGLFNVYKHADTLKAKIIINIFDNHISMQIVDNGKGFEVKDSFDTMLEIGKIGLISMKERVMNNNGTFNVISNKNGTSVLVEIPFDSH